MAFPIMELDRLNVKRSMPIPPFYRLGLIPAGNALRRSKHFLFPEGKPFATQRFAEWSSKTTFLEGKVYLDSRSSTVIVTAFFLEVLPPYASTWEGQTYAQVGKYPYLTSPADLLFSIILHNLDDLINPSTSKPTWQETDVTTDINSLTLLVEKANADSAAAEPSNSVCTCSQRFAEKQLIILAQALYRTPYTIRRYLGHGARDSSITVYYLEPLSLPPVGKRFALEAFHHDNPMPWYRPPCTLLAVVTKYSFASPVQQRTMTTLWNAAHTQARHACVAPKLLQKGISAHRKTNV